jgi:hypothetical protein
MSVPQMFAGKVGAGVVTVASTLTVKATIAKRQASAIHTKVDIFMGETFFIIFTARGGAERERESLLLLFIIVVR